MAARRGGFPATRMRRLRRTPMLRDMVRETRLAPEQLIYPIFVEEGASEPAPIGSMPGQSRWPVDKVADIARDVRDLGISGLMFFGLPAHKDEVGSGAYDPHGI